MNMPSISSTQFRPKVTVILGIQLLVGMMSELIATELLNFGGNALISLSSFETLFLIGTIGFAVGILGLIMISQAKVSKMWYSVAFITYLVYAVWVSTQFLKPGYLFDAEMPLYFSAEFNIGLGRWIFLALHIVLATSLITGGIFTSRSKELGLWSIIPLLLGIWLFIHELILQFDMFSSRSGFITTRLELFLPVIVLFGCIGMGLVTASWNQRV